MIVSEETAMCTCTAARSEHDQEGDFDEGRWLASYGRCLHKGCTCESFEEA